MMGNQCNHLSLGIEVSGILAMCQPKRKQVSELQVLGDRPGPSAAAPCGTWQDQVQGVPKSCLLLWEFILWTLVISGSLSPVRGSLASLFWTPGSLATLLWGPVVTCTGAAQTGQKGMDSCSLYTDSFAKHHPSALELTTALGQSRCPVGKLIGPQKMEDRNWTSPGGASPSWCSLWWVSSLLHLHKWK